MRLHLNYDIMSDTWTLRHVGVRLRTAAQMVAWRAALEAEVRRLGDRPAKLLIDLEDFELDPALAEEYGAACRDVLSPRVESVVRYGAAPCTTKAAIRVAAMKTRHASNIVPDRAWALRAIARPALATVS